jgi:predicted dehydrogenase
VRAEIDKGTIGKVEMVVITSRDPGAPPVDYIKRSGGIFRDMTIHDFDMARFLLGEEVAEVVGHRGGSGGPGHRQGGRFRFCAGDAEAATGPSGDDLELAPGDLWL